MADIGPDCVNAHASTGTTNQCDFVEWDTVNDRAKFNCFDGVKNGLAAGSYTARCEINTETSSNCCSETATTINYTVATGNQTPSADSVSDLPDPVSVDSDVTFTGAWTEPDSGDNVKMYICKDASCSNCNNVSQTNCWCYSSAWNTEPDTSDTCSYTALASDLGDNSYWLGVCDDSNACDASPLSGGTFSVVADTVPPTVWVEDAPLIWQNSNAFALVGCDDGTGGSGCDTDSYKLKIYLATGSCSTTYSEYTLTSPQTISSHQWVCATAKDLAETPNTGFSSPRTEFKVDKIAPTSDITAPPDDSDQYTDFFISVDDIDEGGSGIDENTCYYAVWDATQGLGPSIERICNATGINRPLITIGPTGDCQTIGEETCSVCAFVGYDIAGNPGAGDCHTFNITSPVNTDPWVDDPPYSEAGKTCQSVNLNLEFVFNDNDLDDGMFVYQIQIIDHEGKKVVDDELVETDPDDVPSKTRVYHPVEGLPPCASDPYYFNVKVWDRLKAESDWVQGIIPISPCQGICDDCLVGGCCDGLHCENSVCCQTGKTCCSADSHCPADSNINRCQYTDNYCDIGVCYCKSSTITCGAGQSTKDKTACTNVTASNYCNCICKDTSYLGYQGCAGSGSACESVFRVIEDCGIDKECIKGVCNQRPSAEELSSNENEHSSAVYCFADYPPVQVSWVFNDDPGDSQSAFQIKVYESGVEVRNIEGGSNQSYLFQPPKQLSFNTEYSWKLMVWDKYGTASDWISGSDFTTIAHAYPWPLFTPVPARVSLDEIVTFEDKSVCYTSAHPEGQSCQVHAESYEWDFDCATGEEFTDSYVVGDVSTSYSNIGKYSVKLRVKDDLGTCISDTKEVTVTYSLPEWIEIPPF